VFYAIRDFFDTYLRGSWTSVIDILLVAVVVYWTFILIRVTRAVRIVIGLTILYLVYLVAQALDLRLLSTLLPDRRGGRAVRGGGRLSAGAAPRRWSRSAASARSTVSSCRRR